LKNLITYCIASGLKKISTAPLGCRLSAAMPLDYSASISAFGILAV